MPIAGGAGEARVLLLVTADPALRQRLVAGLAGSALGARVVTAASAAAALAVAAQSQPVAVLVEGLPGDAGPRLIGGLGGAGGRAVALTPDMRPETLGAAEAAGFAAVIRATADPTRVAMMVGAVLGDAPAGSRRG